MFILTILAAGPATGQAVTADFEAVSIKPNISETASMGGFDMLPSGIFRATNIPLSVLFRFAYDVSDQTMAGAPDWFSLDRFDIAGKAPPGTTYPTLRLLLRSMLASQVKLVVHTETKSVSAYALLKTKETTNIEPADGAEKLGCIPVGAQAGSRSNRTHGPI